MKFLCDNCKAKYQIADDKVAGKTVRMKCRKCGHLIELRATAALAEATAFRSLPSEELSRIVDEPLPGVAPAVTGAPKPVGAPKPAPRPAAGVAPRAPVPARPAATPVRSVGRGAAAVALAPEAASVSEVEPLTTKPSPTQGGLASAFSRSVAADTPREETPAGSFDMGDSEASDEWYAGIGGVPVGPVRFSELRAKIAGGQVTEETLVWREGFEEWVALRTVPALIELLRTHQGDRSALTPGVRKHPSGKSEKSNVVSLRPEPTKQPINEDATAIFSGSLVFGQPSDAPAPPAAAPSAPSAAPSSDMAKAGAAAFSVSDPFATPDPFAAPDSFAAPAPATPSAPAAPVAPAPVFSAPVAADFPQQAPPQNRIPPVVWVVVALALAVGVLGGTMLVPKEKAQTEVQVVTIEKVISSPAPDVVASTTSETQAPPDTSATAKKFVPGPMPKGTATAATPSATAIAIAAPLPTFNSPSPLPTANDPPPASTETIPAGKLQEIVNGHRTSIRRTCWDPIVSSGSAPNSVKVSVSLTIIAGRVTAVSVGGADGRLGGCIQGRVRGWQFPTGFAPTSTSFTLAFVAQGLLKVAPGSGGRSAGVRWGLRGPTPPVRASSAPTPPAGAPLHPGKGLRGPCTPRQGVPGGARRPPVGPPAPPDSPRFKL
jgi:predicted Zn finger-like uncharacterized protein